MRMLFINLADEGPLGEKSVNALRCGGHVVDQRNFLSVIGHFPENREVVRSLLQDQQQFPYDRIYLAAHGRIDDTFLFKRRKLELYSQTVDSQPSVNFLTMHKNLLKVYFHKHPEELADALKIPGMVERLDDDMVRALAIDCAVSCKVIIDSGKFPQLKDSLERVLDSFEREKWSTPSNGW